MSDEKFDAIIVGGGLAGCSAAIVLARAGLEVLLIERGDYCGAKNMTGGRLYGHSLEKIIPGFAEEAPIERVVKREKVSLLTPDGGLDIGYSSGKLSAGPECASYTVLRAKFDQWMAEKAEEAGAEVAAGFLVDALLVEDGKVVGISAAGEEMYADVVILADGVNSLLAQQIGMKKELEPHQVAVGAKETIKLSEDVINQRFGLASGEGTAWLSAGDPRRAVSAAASCTQIRIPFPSALWPLWGISDTLTFPCPRCWSASRVILPLRPIWKAGKSSNTPAIWYRKKESTWCRSWCGTAFWSPATRRGCV